MPVKPTALTTSPADSSKRSCHRLIPVMARAVHCRMEQAHSAQNSHSLMQPCWPVDPFHFLERVLPGQITTTSIINAKTIVLHQSVPSYLISWNC